MERIWYTRSAAERLMMNELVVVRSGGLRMRSAITAMLPSTVNTLATTSSALTHSSNPDADANARVEKLEGSTLNTFVDEVGEDVVAGSPIPF